MLEKTGFRITPGYTGLSGMTPFANCDKFCLGAAAVVDPRSDFQDCSTLIKAEIHR
jgi:hypothetical protein